MHGARRGSRAYTTGTRPRRIGRARGASFLLVRRRWGAAVTFAEDALMTTTVLRVAAPRLLTIKNQKAVLHPILDSIDEGARDVVLDLAGTIYVDSSGLAMLAALQRVLVREMGGRLRVSGASPELRILLHATRLDQRLELVDDVDAGNADRAEKTRADGWRAPGPWSVPATA
jgi:anti-anti-sigma factor